jgi:ribulose-5-phosphate 4-epimerase/fuculose-1-phosphate aldolase
LRYDEVTASNLIEIDINGKILNGKGPINYTGYIIHGAIHNQRKDVNCVMHTHSRAGLAISCLAGGLKPIIQDAAMFHNRVSYHDWQGISTDINECKILANNLGQNKVMILKNHGLLTCGKTIGETFMLMYYLDKACKNQLDTLNQKIISPSEDIMEFAAKQYDDPQFELGKHEWPALLRLLDKNESIYKR